MSKRKLKLRHKFAIGSGILVFILMVAFVLGGSPCVTVNRGTVGVKQRFGKVVEAHYGPGLQWKTPFIETIIEVNVQQKNASEHSEAASKDLQKVNTDVKVLYSLNPMMVSRAYDRVGDRINIEDTIITPAIKECFKAVTAKYTAEELITKREMVSMAVKESLDTFIARSCKGSDIVGLIIIDNVHVEDFTFSKEFDIAIEAKVTAEQEALRAEEEKLRTITQAEAEKEKVRLASEAAALKITNEAKAEAVKITSLSVARAEAIGREAAALKGNPELIRLRQVENWDGVLPRFSGGGIVPFMDITTIDGK